MKKITIIYLLIFLLTALQVYVLQGFMSSIVSITSVVLIVFIHEDKQWLEKVLYKRPFLGRIFVSFGLSLLLVFIFHFLWNTLPFTAERGKLIIQLKEWDSLILLMLNIIFLGLIEELIFRGYFQEEIGQMFQKSSQTLGIFCQIAIPALLFSLLHVLKMGPACLIILLPGLIFGCLKYYSGSIYASLGSHIIFNAYYFIFLKPPVPF